MTDGEAETAGHEAVSPHYGIAKTWAVVAGDEILLQAEEKSELERKKRRTKLPDGAETVALPKPHWSVIV